MKKTANVLIIGGGVAGCSVAYHLAKRGCKDVLLLERSELTSGSTWHAAGNTHVLQDNPNISQLHYYTITLYPHLEEETGQSCGIRKVGGLYLASTPERWDQIRFQLSKSKYLGLDFVRLTLDEVHERVPLLNLDGVYGAMFEPNEAHVDPSGVTNAYAAGARKHGAKIQRQSPVVATTQRPDGGWTVKTDKDTYEVETIVTCAGLWAREVGRLAGLELPLIPFEHQYFVTDTIPEIAALEHEMPLIHDNDGEYYLRQEGRGLLVGAYEEDGRHWAVNGTPQDFGHDLLPDDLDRIVENVARAMHRMPCLETAGIKRVINGPMIMTPDIRPLFGPVPELLNYFTISGLIPGFSLGGGLGKMMAEWILDGQPSLDLSFIDVARFGDWVTKDYLMATTAENYSSRFRIVFPYEERPAGRPIKTRPVYEAQKRSGAGFGLQSGWEVPLWFSRGAPAVETYSFRRAESFGPVGKNCRELRSGVGLLDTSAYAKYIVEGPNAAEWLNMLSTNNIPQVGRMALAPMVHSQGGVVADFTIARLDEQKFLLIGAGAAKQVHWRRFNTHRMGNGVKITDKMEDWVGMSISGPISRALMQEITGEDLSPATTPFMSVKRINFLGADAWLLRVSFTGELGYELYFEEKHQLEVYEKLMETGRPYNLVQVGARALLSLRSEKGYGSWGREYIPEFNPFESGMGRFVKLDKENFVGRDALVEAKQQALSRELACFIVEVADADAVGGEPILCGGKVVGRVTSGCFGHTIEKSLALGYVTTEVCKEEHYTIEVIGDPRPATRMHKAPFDPDGKRLRI